MLSLIAYCGQPNTQASLANAGDGILLRNALTSMKTTTGISPDSHQESTLT